VPPTKLAAPLIVKSLVLMVSEPLVTLSVPSEVNAFGSSG